MRTWWHWVLLILGTIVAVVLLAAGGLAYLVYRFDVKGEVERAVENATGRNLTIHGDAGVSYWPVLGFHAANSVLANVPGGREPAFITADDIHIGVEIGPLFNHQIVVRQLVLQHPRIALEVDASGRPNWALSPRTRPVAAPTPSTPRSPPIIDAARTTLRSVDITDGEVTYFDARHGSGWSVGDVDLHTALTALNEPMNVAGSVRYNDKPVQIDMNIASPYAVIHAQSTPLVVNLRGELITAAFEGQTPASSGDITGAVHAYGSSLRQLLAWGGIPLQGGVGFEHFDVTGHLAISGGQFSFDNAGFVLDQLSGRGDFSLSSMRGKPYLSGRLELFDFDLNPYISGRAPPAAAPPPPTPAPAAPATTAPATTTQTPNAQIVVVQPPDRIVDVATPPGAAPIDFSALHAFNADLELATHAVLVSHTRIDSGRTTLVLNDGYLAATMQSLSLYGGSGHGRFEIDARNPDAHIAEELVFDNLNAQPFLTDAINFSNVEGRAELNVNLRTHGRTQREIIANARGRTHVEVVSGVLHGVDLGGVAATIGRALRGELIAPEATTQFQGFSANLAIANGAIASEDLSFNTRNLRIPGAGVVDFINRRLDLRISPRSPRGGIALPFSIRGPFGQFNYNPDLGGGAQREVIARVHTVQAVSRQTN